MKDKTTDNTPGGWRRALQQWLLGSPEPVSGASAEAPAANAAAQPARVGHYTILRTIGQGGMGAVYAARDERLERTIALKMISPVSDSETARQRFWREARAAASLNHPNICQIYEIGEDAGALFIAMELLEGEPLAERLRQGPMRVADALPIALGMLAALSAVHGRGLVHRDLKPSNVFLTPHGVKLLDFGLARPDLDDALALPAHLTRTGVVLGTPRYMAPEQALGDAVDARSDLFATGAILFEMLAGRPAFAGKTVVDILHATVHEQPPALTGSPAVAAVDRVIRRALAKRPGDRFTSADEFSQELRAITPGVSDDSRALARPLTRIVVLPFRVLRPDPETDFLAFSLADAISTSLSNVGSLVVRSSATAARFARETPDLKQLAAEADVDRVVMGTLMRAGGEVRVTAQLVETPGGTLLTAHDVHSPLGDLFALQDDLVRRVVGALALPLAGELPSPAPEAPNPRAYEFYLRANELARSYSDLPKARDLYLRALELDPRFAPAWAHLGRCHRVIGKFVDGRVDGEADAERAFQQALAIDPRLSVAHKFYATLEADMGLSQQAVTRLLREAARHGNDPELFAGLVHTLRYCGLYEESIAAHAEARRLDPHIETSLEQTLLMAGDLERLLAVDESTDGGGDAGIRIMGLGLAGRREEARDQLLQMRGTMNLPAFQAWTDYLLAWLERRTEDVRLTFPEQAPLKIQDDPEAIFLQGWLACDVGNDQVGLGHLQRAVAKGYYVAPTLARSRQFDSLRATPAFAALQAAADAGRQQALAAFREAGGERLLGAHGIRGAA